MGNGPSTGAASVRESLKKAGRRVADPDDPRSLAGRARARRWDEFSRRFPDLREMNVLDLGGTPRFWRTAPVAPAHVTLVNLRDEPCPEPWIDLIVGDACSPPVDGGFDLVFSNSLIEHLPGDRRRGEMARAAVALGRHHWVQTPNRHFPIEPHWVFPGAQFLPTSSRLWLARNWPPAHFADLPDATVREEVASIDLLTDADMRRLFPGAEIWHERFLGLTKSLVAIR